MAELLRLWALGIVAFSLGWYVLRAPERKHQEEQDQAELDEAICAFREAHK